MSVQHVVTVEKKYTKYMKDEVEDRSFKRRLSKLFNDKVIQNRDYWELLHHGGKRFDWKILVPQVLCSMSTAANDIKPQGKSIWRGCLISFPKRNKNPNSGFTSVKEVQQTSSAGNVITSGFWDRKGILLIDWNLGQQSTQTVIVLHQENSEELSRTAGKELLQTSRLVIVSCFWS